MRLSISQQFADTFILLFLFIGAFSSKLPAADQADEFVVEGVAAYDLEIRRADTIAKLRERIEATELGLDNGQLKEHLKAISEIFLIYYRPINFYEHVTFGIGLTIYDLGLNDGKSHYRVSYLGKWSRLDHSGCFPVSIDSSGIVTVPSLGWQFHRRLSIPNRGVGYLIGKFTQALEQNGVTWTREVAREGLASKVAITMDLQTLRARSVKEQLTVVTPQSRVLRRETHLWPKSDRVESSSAYWLKTIKDLRGDILAWEKNLDGCGDLPQEVNSIMARIPQNALNLMRLRYRPYQDVPDPNQAFFHFDSADPRLDHIRPEGTPPHVHYLLAFDLCFWERWLH